MNHGGEFTKLFLVRQPTRASFAADRKNLRIRETTSRVTYLT